MQALAFSAKLGSIETTCNELHVRVLLTTVAQLRALSRECSALLCVCVCVCNSVCVCVCVCDSAQTTHFHQVAQMVELTHLECKAEHEDSAQLV